MYGKTLEMLSLPYAQAVRKAWLRLAVAGIFHLFPHSLTVEVATRCIGQKSPEQLLSSETKREVGIEALAKTASFAEG